MNEYKWIKIVTDIFDDEKTLVIESMPEADSILVIWFKLLCLAGKQNNDGVFLLGKIPYTDEMFAAVFKRPINIVRLALKTFENLGMLEISDEEIISIPNWCKHQNPGPSEKKRERDRLYQAEKRAEQKRLAEKSSDNRPTVDDSSRDSRTTNDDASHDVAPLEREKEIDKEKEYNSIYLSLDRACARNRPEKALEDFDRNVMLSPEQVDDLLERLSLEEFDKYVDIVADCESRGKHFGKSHYRAILDMAAADRAVLPRDGPLATLMQAKERSTQK